MFSTPLRTRRERATSVHRQLQEAFPGYREEARAILDTLLEMYASDGIAQFTIPDVLELPPLSGYGNVFEIVTLFGGAEKLRQAVQELQALLYAA